ncbi:FAD-dependent pyridine nucleotide-disulfide oxidoreductase [Pyrobaculum islandicum DSM 4184]|uniref:FAD-dependent pyridine nucleotide-disulfide oxidoreductase n=1 Tax=Pyrobaculum islandicum (strain DSM 4184 / JCM 9189 / GEO3) TaxID=384616 RepID=A1RS57_PYRIL|nr:FAD-dependent oxidoreductase [Pyrobaculum islandicum]ABL87789.1 FAD-dependent pyridine nucleotide-disulfide oxidoreductase [Pyrobaculum islandicum DSM 4184]
MVRVVIVGGGAAGASAAARARRLDPNAEIILIERGSMITHAPCGMPYAIGGVVKSHEDLMTYKPEEFEKERNIRVLIRSTVTEIDVDKRVVVVERGNNTEKISWDKLVIATGAKPLIPKIPGVELRGILTMRHPDEVPELKAQLETANTVAIVGGGYIGVEMAEILLELGKKVVLFEMFNQVLPTALDPDMAAIVADEMKNRGVELHLGEKVVEFSGAGHVSKVITEKGEYKVDKVILAVGVRPDVDLAVKAGAKLGETGAVYVNEYMETTVPDIYAAGDVAEKTHRVTGRRVWIPLAPTANKEGQVAGGNSVKGRVLKFPGVVGTAVTKFYSLYIARTGLSEREARELGYKVQSTLIKARTKAHYMPGGEPVSIKLVAEESTGSILGAQIVGKSQIVASYADIIALAVQSRYTIEDLFFSDLGYMPDVAPVWHPLIVAARVLSRGKL